VRELAERLYGSSRPPSAADRLTALSEAFDFVTEMVQFQLSE
jgi:hypothetical protein